MYTKKEICRLLNKSNDSISKIITYLKLPFDFIIASNGKKVRGYSDESLNKIKQFLKDNPNTNKFFKTIGNMDKYSARKIAELVNKDRSTIINCAKYYNIKEDIIIGSKHFWSKDLANELIEKLKEYNSIEQQKRTRKENINKIINENIEYITSEQFAKSKNLSWNRNTLAHLNRYYKAFNIKAKIVDYVYLYKISDFNNYDKWASTSNSSKPISNGEKIAESYFKSKNIECIPQYKLLKGKKVNNRQYWLTVDFYLPNLNTCVEINGITHYQDIFHHPNNNNDEIKRKYCEGNNIKLIEIPWLYNDVKTAKDLYSKLNEYFT